MLCHLLSALSLFLCRNVRMVLNLFWRKTDCYHKYYSASNLVVTGANPLRKHQMKNICFALFIFNQSKIQFETLEQYRHSEEHLTRHL